MTTPTPRQQSTQIYSQSFCPCWCCQGISNRIAAPYSKKLKAACLTIKNGELLSAKNITMKSVIYVNNLQAWMKIYQHSCFKVMKLHITAVYIYSVLKTSCNFPLCLQLEKSKANKLNKNSFMTVHPSVYVFFFMPSWSTLDTWMRQPFCVYSAQASWLPLFQFPVDVLVGAHLKVSPA